MTVKASKHCMMLLISIISNNQAAITPLEQLYSLVLLEVRRSLLMAMTSKTPTKFRLRDYQILALRELISRVDVLDVLAHDPSLYADFEAVRNQIL